MLKAALQWSYEVSAPTDTVVFKPMTAWHITSNEDVAKSIVAGGFNPHDGTTGGYGPYFFNDQASADAYEAQQVGRRRRPPVVIEVTIYSNINLPVDFVNGYGGGAWGNNYTGNIICVKNPLLIFPRAAYHP